MSAQRDRPIATTCCQRSNDTGFGQAAGDRDAEALEFACHQIRGAALLEGDLGVGMKIAPPPDHFVVSDGEIGQN